MRWRKSHKMQLIEGYTVLLMGIVKFCEVKTTYTLKLIMNVVTKSLDILRENLAVICRIFTFYFRRHLKISAKNNLHFCKTIDAEFTKWLEERFCNNFNDKT